eukprot:TRINITY_DN13203_c0_g1_i1.p1 TRINITY_DN13203_c0_g1~~TRINITY_DN13203_c0_g1_i1.p1  ORF type:complete len:399 (-),score=60.30 TRINITY_DN13203_c0_g1_i1:92-1186(-)
MQVYRTYHGLETHQIEKCRHVSADGLDGAEDIKIVGDYAFMSADSYRRKIWDLTRASSSQSERIQWANGNGSIFMYNFLTQQVQQLAILNFQGPDFHPHGIFVKETQNGLVLHVVNHRRDGEYIEIFQVNVAEAQVVHVHSMTHVLFRNINSLVPVDDNSFYVSIWQYYDSIETMTGFYETMRERPWTYVAHCRYDNSSPFNLILAECHVAVDDLAMANGLAVSQDGRHLYVFESLRTKFSVYRISQTDPTSLTLDHSVDVFTGCDNLALDETTGDLYSGCHPAPFQFIRHAAQGTLAPSQIVRFSKNIFNKFEAEEMLMDGTGETLSGSSAAAFDPKREVTLVGGVFDPGFLVCTGLTPKKLQ